MLNDIVFPNLLKVLNELSEYVQKEYKKGLLKPIPHRNGKSYDTYSTGNLYNSVDCTVKTTNTGFSVYFSALNNWINVENGRKPGKGVRPEIIEKWIIDREIDPYGDISTKSLGYLINRSIKQQGIKAKPILSRIEDKLDNWNERIIEAANIDLFDTISVEFETQMSDIIINDTSLSDRFLNITIKTI